MKLPWEQLKKAFYRQFDDLKHNLKPNSGDTWCYASTSSQYNDSVHYELIKRGAEFYLEFHVETHANSRNELVRKLRSVFPLRHYSHFSHYSSFFWRTRTPVCTEGDLMKDIAAMRVIVDPVIESHGADLQSQLNRSEETPPVGISAMKLSDLLTEKLRIPEYQRAYCWRHSNVIDMLEGIKVWQENNVAGVYHLGTVILKKQKDAYDIIDGQQRLTTLAIWQVIKNKGIPSVPPLLLSPLEDNNHSKSSRNYLIRAKRSIDNYEGDLDLSRVEFSVIVVGEEQSEDLAYTFFNNTNSAGKRLSDYDLLKTHHLRYIENENMAATMVERWHKMEQTNQQDELLHQLLFRLRNWRSNSRFRLDAENTDERDLYRHYAVGIESIPGLLTPPQPIRFDSVLSGGAEFFNYAERYRQKLSLFNEQPIIQELSKSFQWHSYGYLYSGMKAIAFLFFCKFGDVYLKEAVYCISYRLSELRNKTRVMGLYLVKEPVFVQSTAYLDRVTTESEFFAWMLDPRASYSITNSGLTASRYWESLHNFLRDLEKMLTLPNQHKSKLFKIEDHNAEEKNEIS